MAYLKNKNPLLLTVALCVLFVLFLTVAGGLGVATVIANTPQWDAKSLQTDATSFIYDKNGDQLAVLHGEENRIPVSLKEVPKHVQEAFIAIEDARFYEHKGVDLRAIARAAVANFRNSKVVEGGSTITQQLVKNSFLTPEKTFTRKIKEALLAYDLEKNYTKEEILEFYLNRVYFGHGRYGVQSAANFYFGKNVADLSLTEGALLAGLVQSPNSYSPYNNPDLAKFRMETVLVLMEKHQYISNAQRKAAEQEGYMIVDLQREGDWKHPFFIDYVIDYIAEELKIPEGQIFRGGYKIYTTLDPDIQRIAEEVLLDDKNFPKSKDDQMIQGAMAILDYRTGEIKALVGGRKHEAKRGYNRATKMRRQPGSTFKPIAVYAPALDLKYPPNLILNDSPTTFKGNYTPKNANGGFMGPITMRTAIRWSVNVYAVKLLDLIGVETGYNFARKLGIDLHKNDKVLPMALGGLTHGVTPLEMARAFGVFANKGVLVESTPINKVVDINNKVLVDVNPKKSQVMTKQAAYIMTDLLRNVVNGGTGTAARMNRPVAGKTGTAQVPNTKEFSGLGRAHKDAWFVGYTPELVASVWIGYDITDRNHYITIFGGNNPAQIWRKVMSQALKDEPVKQFDKPDVKYEFKKGVRVGADGDLTEEEKRKKEEEAKKKAEEEAKKAEEEAKKKAEEEAKKKAEEEKQGKPDDGGEGSSGGEPDGETNPGTEPGVGNPDETSKPDNDPDGNPSHNPIENPVGDPDVNSGGGNSNGGNSGQNPVNNNSSQHGGAISPNHPSPNQQ